MEAFDRISTPQKVLILLLIMITIGVAFYFLLYADLEDQQQVAANQKTQLLSQETEVRRKVANQEELTVEVEQLREQTSRIEKALPEKAEIPKLLQQIYGQAKIVGLKIKRFEPGKEKPQQLYVEIPVAMELQGTYDQVADFFFNIGKMERVVNIKNISMDRVSGANYGTGELKISCQAITFRTGGTAGAAPDDPGETQGKKNIKAIEGLYKGTGAIR